MCGAAWGSSIQLTPLVAIRSCSDIGSFLSFWLFLRHLNSPGPQESAATSPGGKGSFISSILKVSV